MLLLVTVFIKTAENKLGQKLVQGRALAGCGQVGVWPR